MGVFDTIFGATKQVDADGNVELVSGRVSQIPSDRRDIRQSTQVISDVLTQITSTNNKFDAIDTIVTQTPDGKTALNVYVTFTNRGGNFTFYNPSTGRRTKRPETAFRSWCEKIGFNNGSGLDGIMDVLARSAYTRGGFAFEVIVSDDAKEISDIAVVDPATFDTFVWLEAEQRYAIYQRRTDGSRVDLYDGNFVYFPYQPAVGSPVGTLKFEPAIQAMTTYYQHILDATTVLNRIGYPRYHIELDANAILETATYEEKKDFASRQELLENAFDSAQEQLALIGRDSDLLTFNHMKVDTLGGLAGSGIDIRGWLEVDEPLICNSFSLQPILMGRQTTGSYALGTATFKAFVDGVEATAKDLKRANEYIANMWCRVHGFNAVAKFEATPLEWDKLIDKWDAELKKQEYYRRSEEYGYISKDEAANVLHGADKADNTNDEGIYEYLKVSLSTLAAAEATATNTTATQTTEIVETEENADAEETQNT